MPGILSLQLLSENIKSGKSFNQNSYLQLIRSLEKMEIAHYIILINLDLELC